MPELSLSCRCILSSTIAVSAGHNNTGTRQVITYVPPKIRQALPVFDDERFKVRSINLHYCIGRSQQSKRPTHCCVAYSCMPTVTMDVEDVAAHYGHESLLLWQAFHLKRIDLTLQG